MWTQGAHSVDFIEEGGFGGDIAGRLRDMLKSEQYEASNYRRNIISVSQKKFGR